VQSKLLNFIQYGEVEIYNSIDLYTSDTRIAASSSKSLVQLLGDKSNNFDLLKRLSAILIELPNLQQRGVADIKLLANSFCNTFNINENKEVSGITEEAMEVLVNHRWKKNIKELRNVILKAVILCDGNYLDVEHFPDLVRANDNKARAPSLKDSNRFIDLFTNEGYHKTLLQIQKEIIQRFLKEFKYKSEDVAKYLNIKHKK
jgi:DNA-binding NtrC family response regulator